MLVKVFFLSLNFLFSFYVVAEEELRDCSFEVATKSCANIQPSDPNAYDPWKSRALSEGEASLAPVREMADSNEDLQGMALSNQAELITTLKSGSSIFKLAVSGENTLRSIGDNLLAEENGETAYGLNIPWPPGTSSSESKIVSWEEFKKGYLGELPESEKKFLLDKAKNWSQKQESFYKDQVVETRNELTQKKVKEFGNRIYQQRKQEERFKDLFLKAKKYLIEELRARPLIGGSGVQEELVKKIEAVQFAPVAVANGLCEVDSENAFFDSYKNSLHLCSGNALVNDYSLIMKMGHELGHAIDPCGCKLHTHQVAQVATGSALRSSLDKLKLPEEELSMAHAVIGSSSGDLIGGLNIGFREETLKKLEGLKLIKRASSGVSGSYPFDTTFRCLRDRHKFTDGKGLGYTFKDAQAKRRGEVKKEHPNPGLERCADRVIVNSELTESMADVFGAKVLGRYALDKKAKAEDLSRAFEMGIRLECAGKSESEKRAYPSFKERYEKIFIAEPLIQKAFKCKPTSASQCMKFFGNLPHEIKKGAKSSGSKTPMTSEKGVR